MCAVTPPIDHKFRMIADDQRLQVRAVRGGKFYHLESGRSALHLEVGYYNIELASGKLLASLPTRPAAATLVKKVLAPEECLSIGIDQLSRQVYGSEDHPEFRSIAQSRKDRWKQ